MEKLSFIGGDKRQIRVINKMAEVMSHIKIYGFDKLDRNEFCDGVEICNSIPESLSGTDGVVLPLPYTLDKETVNAPFFSGEIHSGEVLKCINEGQLLLAGKTDDAIKSVSKLYGIPLIDYLEREELAVLNSIPTAEGAIEIAIRETPHTLCLSKCLVLGNGRIGKILSKMLLGIGADTTVCVRKYKDSAYCKAMGYKSIFLNNLKDEIKNYDIIFNTVPAMVIGYKELSEMKKESLIIDLASTPGGVEFETAKKLGIKVIWALSLPGKVAPSTAGNYIFETILNIFEELGV